MLEANERDGRGFRITFANGWAVSVQWSFGNYCENANKEKPLPNSRNAEVAIFDPNGDFHGDVRGWQTPDQVAAIIAEVSGVLGI